MSIIEAGRRKAGIIILLRRALHLFLLAHVHRTPKQRSAMYIYIYIDETESRAPSSTVEDLPFELLTCSNFFPPPSALPSFFLGRLSDQSESNGSRSISRRRVPSSRGSPRVSWNKVRLIIAGFSFFPTRERAGKRGRQREREREMKKDGQRKSTVSRETREIFETTTAPSRFPVHLNPFRVAAFFHPRYLPKLSPLSPLFFLILASLTSPSIFDRIPSRSTA